MKSVNLCWMEGLTSNLQYFYMPVKSFDLDLMDLKEPVSSFFEKDETDTFNSVWSGPMASNYYGSAIEHWKITLS